MLCLLRLRCGSLATASPSARTASAPQNASLYPDLCKRPRQEAAARVLHQRASRPQLPPNPHQMESAIIAASRAYPKPSGFKPDYGTAGFRAEASLLASTVFRCGILMAARALKLQQVTGICVTASHNPAPDNGVKLVEPSGEMLTQEWEGYANTLANAETDEELASLVADFLDKEGIPRQGSSVLMLAQDTRPSGEALVAAAAAGARCLGVEAQLCGELTTPQLHWMVMRRNRQAGYSEEDYYETLAAAFGELVDGAPALPGALHVDCANGVGAPKLLALARRLEAFGLDLRVYNGGEGELNGGCGSDHLQKEKALPAGFEGVKAGQRCCSVDGDADRLMYFTPREGGEVAMYDGDKIAALAALLVKDFVAALPPNGKVPSVGIIQTAYANGSSSAYVREALGCAVEVTPTGVKYLHEAAHHHDVGIYFEANGHGTVVLSDYLLARCERAAGGGSAPARALLALAALINQAVGDAISGILLVEVALRRKGWGLDDWAALYTDLPSRQSKVKVADRGVIRTQDAETRVAEPEGLQALIDAAVAAVPSGRSFVRPSGTEDVVRVYAEAGTQEAADSLAAEVGRLVHKHAGGVGPEP